MTLPAWLAFGSVAVLGAVLFYCRRRDDLEELRRLESEDADQ